MNESLNKAILNSDFMREWESKLTNNQRNYALNLALQEGWIPPENPPIWIWAEFFRRAELESE